MLKAIIFDMDGVLVDSGDAITESFRIVLSKYGVDFDSKTREKYAGMSLRDQLEIWKKLFPSIPEKLHYKDLVSKALKIQFNLLEKELKPNDVILKFIKIAKNNGIKIAVATSSSKNRAEMFLKANGVFEHLDAFVTCEDVEKHKPNPDIFIEAARRVEVLPSHCVVIEDAINGIAAANSAGMKSVAHLTKYYSWNDFLEADYIFDDFSKLKLSDLEKLFE